MEGLRAGLGGVRAGSGGIGAVLGCIRGDLGCIKSGLRHSNGVDVRLFFKGRQNLELDTMRYCSRIQHVLGTRFKRAGGSLL